MPHPSPFDGLLLAALDTHIRATTAHARGLVFPDAALADRRTDERVRELVAELGTVAVLQVLQHAAEMAADEQPGAERRRREQLTKFAHAISFAVADARSRA